MQPQSVLPELVVLGVDVDPPPLQAQLHDSRPQTEDNGGTDAGYARCRTLVDRGQVHAHQADAITDAVRLAAEHGDHVTRDQFAAGVAEMRTEIAGLDTRLSTQISDLDKRLSTQIGEGRTEVANIETRLSTQISDLDKRLSTQIADSRAEAADRETRLLRWIVGTVLATAALTVGILRLLG